MIAMTCKIDAELDQCPPKSWSCYGELDISFLWFQSQKACTGGNVVQWTSKRWWTSWLHFQRFIFSAGLQLQHLRRSLAQAYQTLLVDQLSSVYLFQGLIWTISFKWSLCNESCSASRRSLSPQIVSRTIGTHAWRRLGLRIASLWICQISSRDQRLVFKFAWLKHSYLWFSPHG